MLIEIYIILILIALITAIYAVLVKDDTNYTHIISGVISGVVSLLVGYQAYIGIGFLYEGDLNTYQYSWIGMLFIVAGVIMILYSLIQTTQIVSDLTQDKEKESEDIHNPQF